jgi:isopentenyl diphosphate isomerase/L-lactate dehydrogenase-like FMN-dependent dehydrogenase
MNTRRTFIKYLAASPLYAGLPGVQSFVEAASLQDVDGAINRSGDALDVFDFEAVARRNIPPAHWGYLTSGVDGEETLRANREAYSRYQLHARRLVDVSKVDMSVELFGTRFDSPIILCPLGAQRAFHPDGELAVARAAKARGHLQVLSTVTSTGVEEVIAARGAPVWFQLYTTSSFDITAKLVKRAEAAGCPAVAVTLECLPEVVAEVRGRVPVIVDGGVRRGTDVLKALALGATAVGIGRPYIWGLGAYGQAGVERVLELLDNELRLAMVGVGARNLREITRVSIVRPA